MTEPRFTDRELDVMDALWRRGTGTVDRGEAGSSAVSYMLRKIFRDPPRLLLNRLVSDRDLSEEDLRELRSLLDERLSGSEGQPEPPEGDV